MTIVPGRFDRLPMGGLQGVPFKIGMEGSALHLEILEMKRSTRNTACKARTFFSMVILGLAHPGIPSATSYTTTDRASRFLVRQKTTSLESGKDREEGDDQATSDESTTCFFIFLRLPKPLAGRSNRLGGTIKELRELPHACA
jgi:hypothetical protein